MYIFYTVQYTERYDVAFFCRSLLKLKCIIYNIILFYVIIIMIDIMIKRIEQILLIFWCVMSCKDCVCQQVLNRGPNFFYDL